MFEQSLLPEQRSRRPWTVFAAFLGQLVLIGIVILIPLLYYQALPQIHLERMILAPPPPPPPPPPPAATPPRQPRVIQRPIETKQLVEPKTIPKHVVMLKEPQLAPEAAPATGVVGGVPGGIPGGSIGGVLGGVLGSVRAPAPPPPPHQPLQNPSRRNASVRAATFKLRV
jgi:periplasmic protein TonB